MVLYNYYIILQFQIIFFTYFGKYHSDQNKCLSEGTRSGEYSMY